MLFDDLGEQDDGLGERVKKARIYAYIWASGGTVVKNPLADAGDTRDASSIPGPGISLAIGNGNPLP